MADQPKHTFVVLAYKESAYLETCIKSVLNQKYPSHVVVGTSTPNDYISGLAQRYGLEVLVNEGSKGIGYDYDFAIMCGKTELVTVAHQDDFYDYMYADRVVKEYENANDPLIVFPDYYVIKNGTRYPSDVNLVIKRLLLAPLRLKVLRGSRFWKRWVLRFGDPICCPAVAYVRSRMSFPVCASDDLVCSVDWLGYERLSNVPGEFVFLPDRLMGHRIHGDSTTSKTIGADRRTDEDIYMLVKFWPAWLAKAIAVVYKSSELANSVA